MSLATAPSAGQATMGPRNSYRLIYAVVSRIPRGRVATYGQVAVLSGLPGQARLVGYALHALPNSTRVPWHRVVNAKGQISQRSREDSVDIPQRSLLEAESVVFDDRDRITLRVFQWRPRAFRQTA